MPLSYTKQARNKTNKNIVDDLLLSRLYHSLNSSCANSLDILGIDQCLQDSLPMFAPKPCSKE